MIGEAARLRKNEKDFRSKEGANARVTHHRKWAGASGFKRYHGAFTEIR